MTAICRNRVSLSSVSLLVLTVACQSGSGSDSGGGGGGAWTAAVDTVADTITVRTLSGSIWPDTAELVPEMTIGMFEGPDEYILGDVRGMAVTEAGEVYLLDTNVPALRKYDAEGTYVVTFGREGGGPEEYDKSGWRVDGAAGRPRRAAGSCQRPLRRLLAGGGGCRDLATLGGLQHDPAALPGYGWEQLHVSADGNREAALGVDVRTGAVLA